MSIITALSLTPHQKEELEKLEKSCKNFEPVTLTFPSEDGDCFFLYYHNQKLVSALSLFFTDRESCESVAFTMPESRKQGFFSALLDEASRWLEDYEQKQSLFVDWCFVTDGRCPAALTAAVSFEMELWYQEHQMERAIEKEDVLTLSGNRLSLHYDSALSHTLSVTAWDGTQKVGHCSLLLGENQAYLYEVEILQEKRMSGYGTDLIRRIFELLYQRQILSVRLQVSGENTAALALYKKTGFHISETLSYYLY